MVILVQLSLLGLRTTPKYDYNFVSVFSLEKENVIMTTSDNTAERRTFLQLLAKGRFAEAEMAMINNPHMRQMVLHLPALRHTRFFKERIRFYRQYARKNRMVSHLREGDRATLRHEFAKSHCKIHALKKACKTALEKMDTDKWAEKARLDRMIRLRKKRQKFLGLF
jgi:hypothetical protein